MTYELSGQNSLEEKDQKLMKKICYQIFFFK